MFRMDTTRCPFCNKSLSKDLFHHLAKLKNECKNEQMSQGFRLLHQNVKKVWGAKTEDQKALKIKKSEYRASMMQMSEWVKDKDMPNLLGEGNHPFVKRGIEMAIEFCRKSGSLLRKRGASRQLAQLDKRPKKKPRPQQGVIVRTVDVLPYFLSLQEVNLIETADSLLSDALGEDLYRGAQIKWPNLSTMISIHGIDPKAQDFDVNRGWKLWTLMTQRCRWSRKTHQLASFLVAACFILGYHEQLKSLLDRRQCHLDELKNEDLTKYNDHRISEASWRDRAWVSSPTEALIYGAKALKILDIHNVEGQDMAEVLSSRSCSAAILAEQFGSYAFKLVKGKSQLKGFDLARKYSYLSLHLKLRAFQLEGMNVTPSLGHYYSEAKSTPEVKTHMLVVDFEKRVFEHNSTQVRREWSNPTNLGKMADVGQALANCAYWHRHMGSLAVALELARKGVRFSTAVSQAVGFTEKAPMLYNQYEAQAKEELGCILRATCEIPNSDSAACEIIDMKDRNRHEAIRLLMDVLEMRKRHYGFDDEEWIKLGASRKYHHLLGWSFFNLASALDPDAQETRDCLRKALVIFLMNGNLGLACSCVDMFASDYHDLPTDISSILKDSIKNERLKEIVSRPPVLKKKSKCRKSESINIRALKKVLHDALHESEDKTTSDVMSSFTDDEKRSDAYEDVLQLAGNQSEFFYCID
mmetsp:Transcript_21646/g.42058  ORF Transcript_21646/g.42058 Transcript_21646/m.42058 type:complete len:696 (+) Transcript_21646:108-2195(+)